MNKRNKALYIVLEDFEYLSIMGVADIKKKYKKGMKISLRTTGRMANELLRKKRIALCE